LKSRSHLKVTNAVAVAVVVHVYGIIIVSSMHYGVPSKPTNPAIQSWYPMPQTLDLPQSLIAILMGVVVMAAALTKRAPRNAG
jgi:hypothetical protein